MDAKTILEKIVLNVEKIIVGKRTEIELVLMALMCRGHVLIEDIPGVGKTSLSSALARSLNCSFKRIQFTPDIMPSDITGFSVFNPKTGEFEYKRGAILSQVVLADEINRTSPKTQSSLLEAMEEKQVTVDGRTYRIKEPFIVLATQNPIEYLGTYPLPEAQMDRFLMRLSLGYPDKSHEIRMLAKHSKDNPLKSLTPVIDSEDIVKIQKLTEDIYMDPKVAEYIVDVIRYTRTHNLVSLGASPRASISLFRAAQANALYSGRDFATPDDVIKMSPFILSHRIILKQEGKLKRVTQEDIVLDALNNVKIPSI